MIPHSDGDVDIKDLELEWSCYPDNDIVTITPDAENPLRAVATFNRAGIACVRVQVSNMPRIGDFCMFQINGTPAVERPSDDDDDDDDDNDRRGTSSNNIPSGSNLTNNEQNRVEAALGSNIMVQVVVENNAGKLVVTASQEVVFCERDGILSKNKWQEVDGAWYYFGSDNKAIEGWLRTEDRWYYMDQDNKRMKTGWMRMADGKWYYLNESGAMAVNTRTPDGYQVDSTGVWMP